jgi:hypothetical protein
MAAAQTCPGHRKLQTAVRILGLVMLAFTGACTAGDADSHVLAEGDDWQLEVGDGGNSPEGPNLRFQSEREDRSVLNQISEYTQPVTLDEATSFEVRRDGEDATLVAGPVHDDTEEVTVGSVAGERADAEIEAAHGLTWFWAELPGPQQVSAIIAYDGDGEILDEYTLPPMPPSPPTEEPADPDDGPDN